MNDEEVCQIILAATKDAQAAHPDAVEDDSITSIEDVRRMRTEEPEVFTFMRAMVRRSREGLS